MSDKGPVAETEWSNETHLQRGKGLVKHWGGGVWGPGAPEEGLGWGDGASPPSQAPLPPRCLPVPLPELGRGMVGLEAVPGPSSQVGSLLLPLLCLPGETPSCPSAERLQAAPGPQSTGTVVIIAILSVLLAVLLTALLALLIYTW